MLILQQTNYFIFILYIIQILSGKCVYYIHHEHYCYAIWFTLPLHYNGGESGDFSILKNGGFLSKPFDSGKTFIGISVNTDQNGMGFEAENPEKMKVTCPSLATFRQRSG